MKRFDGYSRILAGWLILSQIFLPSFAYALRFESVQEGAVLKKLRTGLEEESYYQALLNKAKPGIEPVPGSNIKPTSGDFQTKSGLVQISYFDPRGRVGGFRIYVSDPQTGEILFSAHEKVHGYRSETSYTGWSHVRSLDIRIGGIILGPGVEHWLIGRKDKDLKTPVVQGISCDPDSEAITLVVDPRVELIEGSKRWTFSLEVPVSKRKKKELTIRLVKGKGAAGLEELRKDLKHWVPVALDNSGLLPNSVAYNQSRYSFGMNTSGFRAPSLFYIDVKSGQIQLAVLVPDPSVHGLSPLHFAEADPKKAKERVVQNNPPYKKLIRYETSLAHLPSQIARSKSKGTEILTETRAVLEHPDRSGRTASQRLSLLLKSGRPQGAVEAADAVRKMVDRFMILGVEMNRSNLKRLKAKEGLNIPSAAVPEILEPLIPAFGDWSLERQIRAYLKQEVPSAPVLSDEDLLSFLYDLRFQIMSGSFTRLAQEAPTGALQVVYYDAFRSALLGQMESLSKEWNQASSAKELEETSFKVLALLNMVLTVEQEAELTQMMLKKSAGVLSAGRKVTNAIGCVGILCLDQSGKPALFIPG